jgi:hypothetical protein
MRVQTGIMKGPIETLATGIITAGGTIITATTQTLIKNIAPTRIESIAIPPIKSMAFTRALDTGIKITFTADTHTALKAIPTEIVCD